MSGVSREEIRLLKRLEGACPLVVPNGDSRLPGGGANWENGRPVRSWAANGPSMERARRPFSQLKLRAQEKSEGTLQAHSYWKQLFENNSPYARGRGALRLLRSSRFALTQPDRFATGASTRPRPFADPRTVTRFEGVCPLVVL